MKKKNNLTALIFAVLFLILSIPKFYNKEYIDGLFFVVAFIGFILLFFDINIR